MYAQTRYSVQLVYAMFALCTVASSILTGQIVPEVCEALNFKRAKSHCIPIGNARGAILEVASLPRFEDVEMRKKFSPTARRQSGPLNRIAGSLTHGCVGSGSRTMASHFCFTETRFSLIPSRQSVVSELPSCFNLGVGITFCSHFPALSN
jgi:hypothetical protein